MTLWHFTNIFIIIIVIIISSSISCATRAKSMLISMVKKCGTINGSLGMIKTLFVEPLLFSTVYVHDITSTLWLSHSVWCIAVAMHHTEYHISQGGSKLRNPQCCATGDPYTAT